MNRDEAIINIKTALERRSNKEWSVIGGRGESNWGWITITSQCRSKWGLMSDEDRAELGRLLDLGRPSHQRGECIPSRRDYYQEYCDRANGLTPSIYGRPYREKNT